MKKKETVFTAGVRRTIRERRSVRRYKQDTPRAEDIEQILSAGVWAPSGLNNQPWRFAVLSGSRKDGLARFPTYGRIIRAAPIAICVFMDTDAMYHREKDGMAIGACIQNMLLAAHELGYGTCWLGEILNQKAAVQAYLAVPVSCEFLAVMTLGRPAVTPGRGRRHALRSVLLPS